MPSPFSAARTRRAGGAYRAFGETLRGLKTTFERLVQGRRRSSTPRRRPRSTRASAAATSCTSSRTPGSRSASAARCAPPRARPTASGSSRPRTRPSTGCRRASATRRSTRSTCPAASSAATARSRARSTRSRWATTTRCRTTTAATSSSRRRCCSPSRSNAPRCGAEGEWPPRRRWTRSSSSSPRSAAIGGAAGVVMLRNPFFAVLALVFHLLALAALFLLLYAEFVAAAQVIVYAGAVMVLYVFVVAYVGGDDEPLRASPGPGCARRAAVRRRAVRRAGDRAAGLRPERAGRGRARLRGLRLARADRRAAPDEVPARVRGRLDPAARRGGGAVMLARRRAGSELPDAGADLIALAAETRARSRDPSAGRCQRRRGRRTKATWRQLVPRRRRAHLLLGAGGVLTRRNPLVILLCLELMLNAGNLALIAFARAWGNAEGQIFAIIVMVVAACEVAVGLGLIVAHLPPPAADRRRRAAGAAGMSVATAGWLVLLFPLAGLLSSRSAARWPGRAGLDRHAAIAASFVAAVVALVDLEDRAEEERQVVTVALGLREHGRGRREALAPGRPAVGLHDARGHRRLDADPPLLGRLHGVGPRLRALLRVPELLRLLDAAAGPGGQLPAADRRLGVRRRGVLPADLVLVPAHDGDAAGIKAFVINVVGDVGLVLGTYFIFGAPARSTSSRRSSRSTRLLAATTATWSPAASCCWSARSRSPRRSRCTRGCRTRWRARPPSPP